MTGLLRLLREHPDVVEADLSRYHHIDYRDRWRRDEAGCRRLTFRMIAVRVRHLPPDSATARALNGPGWSLTDYLLGDVFHAVAGKRHPERPQPSRDEPVTPERARKLRSARARAAARRRAIEAGEL